MPGERAKDNKTLTARCAACEKETPTDLMVGLAAREGKVRRMVPVCRACFDKGWRPPGYRGF